jgi:hypothetical protein
MTTRWCSTEAVGGALMERWFQVREGEIGVRVSEADNGVLSLHLL